MAKKSGYGHFSKDGRQFVIERVDTPSPWINYLSNGKYTALISQNAGGYSFIECPKDGRITRWHPDALPADRPGRYIYLRDSSSGEYWSLSWQPAGGPREEYRAAHGFGHTTIAASHGGLESEVTFFVPVSDTLEVWKIDLRNSGDVRRTLSLFSYVEFCLGHALIDLINKPNDQHFNRARFSPDDGAIFATKTYWVTGSGTGARQENKEWDRWAFFASSLPVSSYECSRDAFIGPYRSEADPIGVETGELRGKDVDYGNVAGVLKNELELGPGEGTTVVIVLGVCPKEEFPGRAKELVARYADASAAGDALGEVRKHWEAYMGAVSVEAPDEDLARSVNYWNQYQAKTAFDMSRSASYYHWGLTRGMGFRDSAQDTIGVAIAEPELARQRIITLAGQQLKDGRALHYFHPVSGEGELTGHSDDPPWLVLAAVSYVEETGDVSLLEEQIAYRDGGRGTLLEHLSRAIGASTGSLGPRGIPVFGRGDWNDTLDYVGGEKSGESIWGGMFLAHALGKMSELLGFTGMQQEAGEMSSVREALVKSLNEHCWDGKWYIRAINEKGGVLGSSSCREGRIFLNPQAWAVISGVAGADRGREAMDSVAEHLGTRYGPKLLAPAYTRVDPEIGLITRCAPGKKENGAIFCHAAVWCIIAECMLGRGDRAFDYYRKLLPSGMSQDLREVEPYVYAQYVTSDEHETFGQASHSWLTGTAAWMFRAALDYMLGVRPSLGGLLIDPCIPESWGEYRVRRLFRGAVYDVVVKNPLRVSKGVARMTVDGREHAGNRIPVVPAGGECTVIAEMGREG